MTVAPAWSATVLDLDPGERFETNDVEEPTDARRDVAQNERAGAVHPLRELDERPQPGAVDERQLLHIEDQTSVGRNDVLERLMQGHSGCHVQFTAQPVRVRGNLDDLELCHVTACQTSDRPTVGRWFTSCQPSAGVSGPRLGESS